jgi:small conductance mechanosensitive channel
MFEGTSGLLFQSPSKNLSLENFDLSAVATILSEKMASWLVAATRSLPNLIAALILLVLFVVVAKLARRGAEQVLNRVSNNQSLNNLFATIISVTIIFMGLFIALGILNLDKTVTSLLTGAGIVTLALGFAFQDIASNFFAGILIAFRKPYQHGDIVQIDNYIGEVRRIELRMTLLRTFDGLDVLIPNKNMLTQVLTNATSTPGRRVSIFVGVAYGSELALVEKVVREALLSVEDRLPNSSVEFFFKEFSDSSIQLEGQFWIDYVKNRDLNIATHRAIVAIDTGFRKHGITIPFPVRTVHMSDETSGLYGRKREGPTGPSAER